MNAGRSAASEDRRWFPMRPGETPVALASVGLMIIAAAAAGFTGESEFLFYIAVVAALMAAAWHIHRRVRFTTPTLWALWLWAALHMAGGLVPVGEPEGVLYNVWLVPTGLGFLKFDQLVHAYGFAVAAWASWQALETRVTPPRASVAVLTAAALCSMGLGAVNEVIEFTATQVVRKTNVGGYENNAWDLVFNGVGAFAAVTIIRFRSSGGKIGQY